MKKIIAMALMGLMALSVGLSAREVPLSVSTTSTSGQRSPLRASVLYGRTVDGGLSQVLVGADGALAGGAPSGTQNVDPVANTIGLATGAKQDADNALLTTIDADTGSIATDAGTIAGAVSGTEMQVDVLTLPALVTGSAIIGATKPIDESGVYYHGVTGPTGAWPATPPVFDPRAPLYQPSDTILFGGTAAVTGAGVNGTEVLRVTVATDDEINDDLDTIAGAVSGTEMQVDIVGAGTLALDASVDGVEALLTTIDTDTSALFGTVAGTELQVDIVDPGTLALDTSVDGVEALLTTIDTDTGSIDSKQTDIELNTDTGTTVDHAAVTVGNSATLILAASTSRRSVVIINAFTDLVAVGNSDVTLNSAAATDGFVLKASGAANDGTGGSITINSTAAIYGIGASASSKVIYFVESD